VDWINDQVVGRTSTTSATVKTDDVLTRIGVNGLLDAAALARATIQGVRLKAGNQVVLLGEAVAAPDGSKWWPVQPPPAEERFLRADAVRVATVVQPVPPAAPPRATETAPAMPTGSEPLWAQAQQAEQAGNYAEAERLYTQLARQTPDHELALRCYNRVQYLRDRAQGTPGYPAQANYPNAGPGVAPPVPGTLPPPATLPPVGQAPPIGYAPAAQASGKGWLRRAGFYLDNKPTYVLESTEGRPPLYVTAQTSVVNLESCLFRNVELYGPMCYRGDVKANYMTATQVVLLP
jgi:hypothetical protein